MRPQGSCASTTSPLRAIGSLLFSPFFVGAGSIKMARSHQWSGMRSGAFSPETASHTRSGSKWPAGIRRQRSQSAGGCGDGDSGSRQDLGSVRDAELTTQPLFEKDVYQLDQFVIGGLVTFHDALDDRSGERPEAARAPTDSVLWPQHAPPG